MLVLNLGRRLEQSTQDDAHHGVRRVVRNSESGRIRIQTDPLCDTAVRHPDCRLNHADALVGANTNFRIDVGRDRHAHALTIKVKRATGMKKKARQRQICPRCDEELILYRKLPICARCLLIWRGDTFEPISREALGLATLTDYFYSPDADGC